MMKATLFLLAAAVLSFGIRAAEPAVQGFDMVKMWKKPDRKLSGPNKMTPVMENGRLAAVRINYPSPYRIPVTFRLPQYPCDGGSDPEKKYEGIAFEIQGDGSSEWDCITVGDTPNLQGRYFFPLSSKEWKEFRVSFADMAPAGDHTAGLPAQMKAGMLNTFQFSDGWRISWCNRKRTAFSYQVRNLRLIEKIRPSIETGKYAFRPLSEIITEMKAGKKILISCFGDSITAGTSLRPGEKRYAVLLGEMLAAKFKNPNIRTVCTAVGGAHTCNLIDWLDRDLTAGMPDVATLLIGYNNKSHGQSPELFRKHLEIWLDRLAARTKGKTAVILIPTIPGVPRWDSQDDFARIVVETAEKYHCSVVRIDQAIKKIGPQEYRSKYLRDSVHPGPDGHRLFAEILTRFLE